MSSKRSGNMRQTLTGVLAIMHIFNAFMTQGPRPAPTECFSLANVLAWPSVRSVLTAVLLFIS